MPNTQITAACTLPNLKQQYNIIKASRQFNTCMFNHYSRLYKQQRKDWDFCKITYTWFKMMHYEEAMLKARISELLTQLNKESHVAITTTV